MAFPSRAAWKGAEASDLAFCFLKRLPGLREMALKDVNAALNGDPAAKSIEEIIMSYPGLEAITVHRMAHELYKMNIPLIPRMMNEHIHRKTGVDIHPGASGSETPSLSTMPRELLSERRLIIGKNVKIYQGVTLGALER